MEVGHSRALKEHLDTQGTQSTEALGHSKYSGTRRALRHSGSQGTWAVRHRSTRALEGHLGTWARRHSGNWALEALEALYLANSKHKILSIGNRIWRFRNLVTARIFASWTESNWKNEEIYKAI